MHKGKYVFAQLQDFIDKDVFLRIANKYDGNRYVKHFTCWNQLSVLMFGQLSNRESLRDVVLAPPRHIVRKPTISGSGELRQRATSPRPTAAATTASSRSSPIAWCQRPVNAGQRRFSSLAATSMPSTRQLSTCV